MGVKVNRCDIVPPLSGSAGVPVNAPYLLNGVDPSGLLTAEVNVLALATPQPFIATAPIAGDIGLPITLAYDNGVGAVGTGVGLQFKAQNAADATKDIVTVVARLTDATAGSEGSEVDVGVLVAGAEQTALTIADAGLSLNGSTGAKTITTSKGALTVSATGGTNPVTVTAPGSVSLTGGTSAAVTGATTATVQAGSGAATLQSTAAGAAVLGQTTASLTATTGAASVVATAGAASVAGQTAASLTAATGNANVVATTGNVFLTANGRSWNVDQGDGRLTASTGVYFISQVAPGVSTGDVLVYQQVFDAGVIAPTAGGLAVAMDPGAVMAQQCELSVTAAAGVYLVTNNAVDAIRILGVDVLLPATFAAGVFSVVANAATLFSGTGLAALGVAALPVAAGYSAANATVAAGADITINATDATLGGATTAFVIIRYQVA